MDAEDRAAGSGREELAVLREDFRAPAAQQNRSAAHGRSKRLYFGYLLTGVFGPLDDSEAEYTYLPASLH